MNDESKLKVSTPGDRDILMTRVFDAPRKLVFDAHTKPELVKQWMLGPDGWSMPVCEIDLRPDGKFRYVWVQDSDGADLKMSGTFHEVVPPERIVHTEKFEEEWTEGSALVTTIFTEENVITTMTMTMRLDSTEIRNTVLATGMSDGMETGYKRLDNMLMSMLAS